MSFNFLDCIFIVILVLLGIHGSVVGFIKEFFSKAAIIIALFAAIVFFDTLSPYLYEYIKIDFLSKVLAFLLILIVVFLVVKLIQNFIGGFFSGETLKSLDKLLGFILGLAEGLLIVCVVLIIMYAQPWFEIDPAVGGSVFHEILKAPLAAPVGIVQGFIA